MFYETDPHSFKHLKPVLFKDKLFPKNNTSRNAMHPGSN